MICGQNKKTFSEASHVCFEGHLGNPSFRAVAIQKLISCGKEYIVTDKTGQMKIRKAPHGERVRITYHCVVFGDVKTWGYPFKDTNTDGIIVDQE